ncbi:hypothetical protein [uncultured Thermomonospora sp.]|uniref:hypothetical protein n=1 Tax=uncultured Thermomonospora sp. TaxID=671175 RepID=UPI00259BB8A2|nr:hypothetical protein [uncultured Thermomonospora sp.]
MALEEVELIGGPYDGHRQRLVTREQLDTRRGLGAWMILPDGASWPDGVPEGCVPRAVYEPDPAAPPDRWLYRGLIYI